MMCVSVIVQLSIKFFIEPAKNLVELGASRDPGDKFSSEWRGGSPVGVLVSILYILS
jgi:hypothetical protein